MPIGKGESMLETGLFKAEIKLIKLIKWKIQKVKLLKLLFIHRLESRTYLSLIHYPLTLYKLIQGKKKTTSEDAIVI